MQVREVVLDTETTGLYPKNGDRIVEIGCVEVINKVRTGKVFHTYVNPQRDMPHEAFKVHGISYEFLQDKPLFRQIAEEFLNFIGTSAVVIHNAGFDLGFLNHELGLVGYGSAPINPGKAIDTLTIARKKFPGSPASLDALCRRFNICLAGRDKHGALLDADLLAQVYLHLCGNVQNSIVLPDAEMQNNTVAAVDKNMRDFESCFPEIAEHKNFIQQKLKKSRWYHEA